MSQQAHLLGNNSSSGSHHYHHYQHTANNSGNTTATEQEAASNNMVTPIGSTTTPPSVSGTTTFLSGEVDDAINSQQQQQQQHEMMEAHNGGTYGHYHHQHHQHHEQHDQAYNNHHHQHHHQQQQQQQQQQPSSHHYHQSNSLTYSVGDDMNNSQQQQQQQQQTHHYNTTSSATHSSSHPHPPPSSYTPIGFTPPTPITPSTVAMMSSSSSSPMSASSSSSATTVTSSSSSPLIIIDNSTSIGNRRDETSTATTPPSGNNTTPKRKTSTLPYTPKPKADTKQNRIGDIKVTRNIRARRVEKRTDPLHFPESGILYEFNVKDWDNKMAFYDQIAYSFGVPSTQKTVLCCYLNCPVMHYERTCQGVYYCPHIYEDSSTGASIQSSSSSDESSSSSSSSAVANPSCTVKPCRYRFQQCDHHKVSLKKSEERCKLKLHFYVPKDPNNHTRLLLCIGAHNHPIIPENQVEIRDEVCTSSASSPSPLTKRETSPFYNVGNQQDTFQSAAQTYTQRPAVQHQQQPSPSSGGGGGDERKMFRQHQQQQQYVNQFSTMPSSVVVNSAAPMGSHPGNTGYNTMSTSTPPQQLYSSSGYQHTVPHQQSHMTNAGDVYAQRNIHHAHQMRILNQAAQHQTHHQMMSHPSYTSTTGQYPTTIPQQPQPQATHHAIYQTSPAGGPGNYPSPNTMFQSRQFLGQPQHHPQQMSLNMSPYGAMQQQTSYDGYPIDRHAYPSYHQQPMSNTYAATATATNTTPVPQSVSTSKKRSYTDMESTDISPSMDPLRPSKRLGMLEEYATSPNVLPSIATFFDGQQQTQQAQPQYLQQQQQEQPQMNASKYMPDNQVYLAQTRQDQLPQNGAVAFYPQNQQLATAVLYSDQSGYGLPKTISHGQNQTTYTPSYSFQ